MPTIGPAYPLPAPTGCVKKNMPSPYPPPTLTGWVKKNMPSP
jgi:hypothetical protein